MTIITYEELLMDAGGFGFYQIFVLAWNCLSITVYSCTLGFMIFGGLKIFPGSSNTTLSFQNDSKDADFYSLVDEFDFRASDAYKITLITSSMFAGAFIGYMISGHLSDKFGRKPVYLPAMIGITVTNICLGFCQNWLLFLMIRFLTGICLAACIATSSVLTNEILLAKWRTITNVAAGPVGYVMLALMAKSTNHWRILLWYTVIPAPIVILMTFALVDSPKLLIERRKIQEAKKALMTIGRWNKVKLTPLRAKLELVNWEKDNKSKLTLNVLDLFYNRIIAGQISTIAFCWCCSSINYFAMLYNVGNLGGDPASRLIYTMLIRFFFSICLPIIDQCTSVGRRGLTLIGLFLVSLCHVMVIISFCTTIHINYPLVTGLVPMVGTAVMPLIMAMYKIFIIELVPTILRTIAVGTMLALAGITTVIAPQVFLLVYRHPAAPYICLLPTMLIAIILVVCVLPETKGKPLPDLPADVKLRKQKKKEVEESKLELVD